VPSPRPATSCFPLLLHDTQLTPSLRTGPFCPRSSSFLLKSAINNSPLTVTAAKSSDLSVVGFGHRKRRVAPLRGRLRAGCDFLCSRSDTRYAASPLPSLAATTSTFSSAENARWEIGAERGTLTCGSKGLMLLVPDAVAENASLTESVLAITNPSGPAAARRPWVDAMLNKEHVGGGRESEGQGVGSSRTLESPAMDRKPTSFVPS
jgi:hypothetical protein